MIHASTGSRMSLGTTPKAAQARKLDNRGCKRYRYFAGDVQQAASSCNVPCRVTNPHEFDLDGVTFLGTSGQNIEDIDRYSTEEDRLRMLEHVLEWGHLAPTAPDTLTAYSFSDKDPFVIESAPHVLFAGNQPSFQSKLVKGAL